MPTPTTAPTAPAAAAAPHSDRAVRLLAAIRVALVAALTALVLAIAALAYVVSFEAIRAFAIETAAFPPSLAWSAPLLVDSFTTAASLVILWRYLRGDAWRDPWYAWTLYRARKRASEQARQRAQDDARRRAHEEQARRARDRTRRTPPPHAGTSRPGSYCGACGGHRGPHTFHHDQAAHDRARRRYDGLSAKAASTGFPEEAAACRTKAEQLRAKYGL